MAAFRFKARLKIFLIFIALFSTGFFVQKAQAQYKVKKKPHNKKKERSKTKFERSQWWLGIRMGGNFTAANVGDEYTVLNSTNPDPDLAESYRKEYFPLKKSGIHFGIEASYNFFNNFTVTIQPAFMRNRYEYTNQYSWTNATNINEQLDITYTHTQQLEYIEIPLMFRYEIFQEFRVKPFVQGGFYVGFLLDAQKEISVSGNDLAAGSNAFANASTTVQVKDLYNNNNAGVMFGGGLNCDFGNFRLALECNYKTGLSQVVNPAERYSNPQLVGIADALDDKRLNNLEFSLGFLFPLKYLEKSQFEGVNP